MTGKLAPGALIKIDRRASAQFAGQPGFTFRVISVCDKPTYRGWAWITGYVLDQHGQATEKREIFVRLAGLHLIPSADCSATSRVGR
ncbi:hypothetical protein GCM10027280_45770 [Micromonospora polyrhachis]|nr:hypothetical protein [Micromonospora polyrhachis]